MNDARAQCKHENFKAGVEVFRLTDESENEVVDGFVAEVQVRCTDCGTEFVFDGVEAVGLLATAPSVSPDRTQLRVPIKPPAVLAKLD